MSPGHGDVAGRGRRHDLKARSGSAPIVPDSGHSRRPGRFERGGDRIGCDEVIDRLAEAGATLLAMPGTGWTTRIRTSSIEIVRTAVEAYGREAVRVRPAVPSAEKIDRMDEAWGWLTLIPQERYVLRRVVGARSLVHPITERHLYSWRRLAGVLGADHKAVQRWHAQAISLIVAGLRRTG